MLPLLFLVLPSALAFSEDLCFEDDVTNCFSGICLEREAPERCCEPGEDTPRCREIAVVRGAKLAVGRLDGRSMVHVDATDFLAQAVGFDPTTAYWIAAYDQATDDGQYIPRDVCGEASLPSSLETADIVGVTRMSIRTAGAAVHVSLPYAADSTPVAGIDGLHPVLHDFAHETLLYNARRWALGEDELCVLGLTDAPGTDGTATDVGCYRASGRHDVPPEAKLLYGDVPTFARFSAPYHSYLGDSILVFTSHGLKMVGDPVYAVELGESGVLFGATAPDIVRIGIYMHILQDRISHHRCGDASYLAAPDANGKVGLVYDREACTQGLHALWHSSETAWGDHPEASAAITESALYYTYRELLEFAAQRGLVARLPEDTAVGAMMSALAVQEGSKRLAAMLDAVDAAGFARLPGHERTRVCAGR